MTFYELIRASLLSDAELHPYPRRGGDSQQEEPEQETQNDRS